MMAASTRRKIRLLRGKDVSNAQPHVFSERAMFQACCCNFVGLWQEKSMRLDEAHCMCTYLSCVESIRSI